MSTQSRWWGIPRPLLVVLAVAVLVLGFVHFRETSLQSRAARFRCRPEKTTGPIFSFRPMGVRSPSPRLKKAEALGPSARLLDAQALPGTDDATYRSGLGIVPKRVLRPGKLKKIARGRRPAQPSVTLPAAGAERWNANRW